MPGPVATERRRHGTRRHQDQAVTAAPPGADAPAPRRSVLTRAWVWVLLVTAVLVALLPVWASPVQSDDRYWYLISAADFDGSLLAVLAQVAQDADPANGRVTPLAFAVRRLAAVTVLDLAVATGVPVAVWHALVKLLTLLAAVAAVHAFVSSLRRRGPEGLEPLSRGTRTFLLAGTVAAAAAGAQTQVPARNGWVAYPLLTVGAVVVVLGTLALLLVLARAVGRGGARAVLLALLVGVVLGVVLNTTYELYVVAVPAGVVLLLLMPVTAGGRLRDEVRAKVLTLTPFLVSFVVVLVAIRAGIAAACQGTIERIDGIPGEQEPCYVGTDPSLGTGVLVTGFRNLLGSLPVFGRTELLEDMTALSDDPVVPALVSPASLLLGLLLAGCLVVLWRLRPGPAAVAGDDPRPGGTGEVGVLLRAAVVVLLVALGAAGIMSLSVQAQELVASLGLPYRHTVLAWFCLALAGLLAVRALVLLHPARAGLLVLASAVVLGTLVAVTFPSNVAATRTARNLPGSAAVVAVHGELARGDLSRAGDIRRCDTVALAHRDVTATSTRTPLLRGADESFRLYFGEPYCSLGTEDPRDEGADG
ncbi:hypothetical protein [Jannaschia sp. R86511]|uniref:hypothetical protein n=1 Tax=Jannaschia sp. R86511 TaxID=3093853 RepID=UPI0036D2094A